MLDAETKPDDLEGFCNVLAHVANGITHSAERHLTPKDKFDEDRFPYIPMDVSNLLRTFSIVKNNLPIKKMYPKFLDAGCGIGMTLRIAQGFGFWPCGIECEQETIDYGKQILGVNQVDNFTNYVSNYVRAGNPEVKKGDILEFDDYGKFDIIYFYRPLKNHIKEEEFEKRVISQAKKNTLIIAKASNIFPYGQNKKYSTLLNRKVKSLGYNVHIVK